MPSYMLQILFTENRPNEGTINGFGTNGLIGLEIGSINHKGKYLIKVFHVLLKPKYLGNALRMTVHPQIQAVLSILSYY